MLDLEVTRLTDQQSHENPLSSAPLPSFLPFEFFSLVVRAEPFHLRPEYHLSLDTFLF